MLHCATQMPDSLTDIGIIMLAAGYSKRFQGDKRLALLSHGRTLLETTLSQVPDSFTRRILVLHPGDEPLARQFSGDWSICIADSADQGMGCSLAAGIQLAQEWPAVVIGLADMPYVQTGTYQMIQRALLEHALVRPYCQGRPGNPVGLRSEFYPALAALEADQGARSILQANADRVFRMECPDWGITQDVDTPAALDVSPEA